MIRCIGALFLSAGWFSTAFASPFQFEKVEESSSLRLGDHVYRYLRTFTDPCLYVQKISPENGWKVTQERAYCEYQGKRFITEYAYAQFEDIRFSADRIMLDLNLISLPPISGTRLSCYVDLQGGIIGDLKCL